MSDVRSFLRYLVPGFVFIMEIGGLILISGASINFEGLSLRIGTSLGAALGAIAVSGALGYFFGVVHHTAYWCIPGYAAADQRHVLASLQEKGYLALRCYESDIARVELSKAGAWRVFTALWHTRTAPESSSLASATARAESLTDLMHGAGSSLVAGILASCLGLGAAFYFDAGACRTLIVGLAAASLLSVHWISYRIAGAHAEGFTDLVLFDWFSSESSISAKSQRNEESGPVVFSVRKRDLAGG